MKTNEYDRQSEQIIQMLTPKVEVKPSPDMRERILQAAEQAAAQPKRKKSRMGYWLGTISSAAAVIGRGLNLYFGCKHLDNLLTLAVIFISFHS